MGTDDPSTDERARPDAAWEARRAELVAEIPRGYRAGVHFAGLVGLAGGAAALALAQLRDVRPLEWLVLPVAFVVANGVEWLVHRGPLHKPTRARILYQRHTLTHHVAFRHDAMAVRDYRELRVVLFPLYALPGFLALAAPLAALAWALASRNAALLFFATAVGYYLLYELCHLSYHLPEAHPVACTRAVRWLRRHHQRHHDPRRMTAGNFNVTIPLWDALLGTYLRED